MRKRKILISFLTVFAFMLNFQMFSVQGADTTAKVTRSIGAGEVVRLKSKNTLIFSQDEEVKVERKRIVTIMPTPENTTSIPTSTPTVTPRFKDKEVVIVMDTSRLTTSAPETGGDPFDYALFSGSDDPTDNLNLSGNEFILNGDCHSNSGIIVGVGRQDSKLEGKLNHLGTFNIYDGGVEVDAIKADEKIDMPNLVNNFNTTNAIRFSDSLSPITGDSLYKDYLKTGSDNILSDEYGEDLEIAFHNDGENSLWTISGDIIKLDKDRPFFFDGKVNISVNGVTGNGVIVATDDIVFNPGSSVSGDIGIYSAYGNIDLNMAAMDEILDREGKEEVPVFRGLLYAPGASDGDGSESGKITVRSKYFNFEGSIVGKGLDLTGDKNIKYSITEVHDDFSDPDIENFLLDKTKEKVIEIINHLSNYDKSNVKLATIIYSDYAKIINSDFSKITSIEDLEESLEEKEKLVEDIYDIVENDGCNLGDGLRLAYHLFESKGNVDADKYLIVFSNNSLNKYTVNDAKDDFRTDNLELRESDIPDYIRTNKGQSYKYAEEMASLNSTNTYKGTYFIDVRPENDDVDKFSKIGQKANAKEVDGLYCYNPENKDGVSLLTSLSNVVSEISAELVIPDEIVVPTPTPEATPTPVSTPTPVITPIIEVIEIDYDVKVEFGFGGVDVNGNGVIDDNEVAFSNKLPEGVDFVSSDDLDYNETDRILSFADESNVITNRITDPVTDKEVLTAIIPDLRVMVEFNATGDHKFEKAKLKYIFTNKDDSSDFEEIIVDIEELIVNVGWVIDIN